MIAVDTNILVYADREESTFHASAVAALRLLAEGDEAWAVPVFCVSEFFQVVSHDRLFDPPTPVIDAVDSIDSLLASPSVRFLVPGDRHLRILRRLIEESQVTGNLVIDAKIAALCLEHGATTLITEDRDFTRFRSLQTLTLTEFLALKG